MSGQTVTSKGLQFTNDNKSAYAFSGSIDVDSTAGGITLLEFNTNSEYIDQAKFTISNYSGSGDDIRYEIFFNDIIVFGGYYGSSSNNNIIANPVYMTIPPFTTVKISAVNLSSGVGRVHSANVCGTVGMPQRVGNLDD